MDRYATWEEAVNAASLVGKPALVVTPSSKIKYFSVVSMNRALPSDDVVGFVDGDFVRKVFM